MHQGKLYVKKRNDGTLRRQVRGGGKKINLPAVYDLDESYHDKACEYELTAEGITKIVVDGQEVPKNTELEAERQRRREEAAKRREEEKEAERQARAEARRQPQRPQRGHQPASPQANFNIAERSKLPRDTRDLLSGMQDQIDNLALRIQKGANFWEENKEKATLYQEKKGSRKRGIPDKLMRHLPDGEINYGDLDVAQLAAQADQTAVELYGKSQVASMRMATDGRLIVGIGGATVFEVGITLHHIYGIPYIPASGIKGAVRSWMIQEQFEGSEGRALADQDFCDIFGCPAEWKDKPKDGSRDITHKSWYERKKRPGTKDSGDQEGKIVFFDAFPTQAPVVEEDIMNVHYPKYYQGETAPTDYQQPNPISFLTVGHDTPFQFVIAAQQPGLTGNDAFSGQELLHVAFDWLQQTLTAHGLGAKTALGYGFFQLPA